MPHKPGLILLHSIFLGLTAHSNFLCTKYVKTDSPLSVCCKRCRLQTEDVHYQDTSATDLPLVPTYMSPPSVVKEFASCVGFFVSVRKVWVSRVSSEVRWTRSDVRVERMARV